ncbi:hypothetical protein V1478_012288 [Vespula squamosa]|uniref:Uncharacterized protein n=1 Tax=Vespula squamosa TaxID=30214 RepID=A0ABD2ACR7_VESSQ
MENKTIEKLGLLRNVVLYGSLLGDPGFAVKTDEEHRRRARWAFCTETHNVRLSLFPMALLPHHVHPRGLWHNPRLLNRHRYDRRK